MVRLRNRERLESLVPEGLAKTWPRPERKRIFILFTPRSGSSWFGGLLTSTLVFGNPDEYLNQDTNADLVRRFAARTEIDYLNAVEQHTASYNGVFSIEAVWGHLEFSEIDILDYYSDAHFIYLRRRDILAQAISLALAVSSGVFHKSGDTAQDAKVRSIRQIAGREETFASIRRWWGHLMNYECLAEVQFLLRGIRPLRIYYEDIVADPAEVISRVRASCGISPLVGRPPSSSYTPVSGPLNAQLAKSFLKSNQGFADAMNAFRPPLG